MELKFMDNNKTPKYYIEKILTEFGSHSKI